MYIPADFAETDTAKLHDLIEQFSFGLLVTVADGAPFASHLPFMLDREHGANGTLVAHMARANPQWENFAAGGEALAIFQGPHAYISPSWYEAGDQIVPTWNYAVVHAYGVPDTYDDPAHVRTVLDRLTGTHERAFAAPWRLDSQDEKFLAAMEKGLVAFEIPIARLEGKFKLSQNRPAGDRPGIVSALRATDEAGALEIASLMERD